VEQEEKDADEDGARRDLSSSGDAAGGGGSGGGEVGGRLRMRPRVSNGGVDGVHGGDV